MSVKTMARRDVAGLLNQVGRQQSLSVEFDADALAGRLRSLAVAASLEVGAQHGRWGRRVAAVVGAVGIVGWAGIGAASASVGLAFTGNFPAPVQKFVSDVFDVVGVELPKGTPSPPADLDDNGEDEESGDEREVNRPEAGVDEGTETTVPTDTTVLEPPGKSGLAPGETGMTPGQSGSTPGQSGSTPGQSGSTPGQSDARPPGQSGNTPGQSGTAPGKVTRPPSLLPSPPSDGPGAPGDSRPSGNGNSGERNGSDTGNADTSGGDPRGAGGPGASEGNSGSSANSGKRSSK